MEQITPSNAPRNPIAELLRQEITKARVALDKVMVEMEKHMPQTIDVSEYLQFKAEIEHNTNDIAHKFTLEMGQILNAHKHN